LTGFEYYNPNSLKSISIMLYEQWKFENLRGSTWKE